MSKVMREVEAQFVICQVGRDSEEEEEGLMKF